jgi:hypothetical protein
MADSSNDTMAEEVMLIKNEWRENEIGYYVKLGVMLNRMEILQNKNNQFNNRRQKHEHKRVNKM